MCTTARVAILWDLQLTSSQDQLTSRQDQLIKQTPTTVTLRRTRAPPPPRKGAMWISSIASNSCPNRYGVSHNGYPINH